MRRRSASTTTALLAAVTGVAALATTGAGAATQAAPASWKLVYERDDLATGEGGVGIDIVASGQRRPRRLTKQEGAYSRPALSPDGREVAYLRSAGGRDELWVVDADASSSRTLAVGQINDFVWSGDGTRIAFTTACGYAWESGCRSGRIEVIRRDGEGRRVLARPEGLGRDAEISLQQWSRGGDLLFILRNQGQERLHVVGARTGSVRVLADRRSSGDLGEASWSTDGGLIAYMCRCADFHADTYCDLAVMSRDGSSERPLVRRGPMTGYSWKAPSYDAPAWIGPRRLVVALSGFGAQTHIVDVVTGSSSVFSRSFWEELAVSRDGRRVAAVERRVGAHHVVLASSTGKVLERAILPHAVPSGYDSGGDLWIR